MAESYSDSQHLSKNDIYDQLVSQYGGKFTSEQANTELIIFAYFVNHDEIFRKINKKRLWKMIKESVIFFILAFILNIIENKNVLLMMSINSIFNIFSFLCIILLYFFIIFLLSCSFLYVFFVISLILYHYSIKYF